MGLPAERGGEARSAKTTVVDAIWNWAAANVGLLGVWLEPLGDWLGARLTSGDFWLGAIPTVVVAWALFRFRRHQSDSLTVALPFGLGSRSYDTTPADRIVAWKLHVQLVTRKAALPFDEDCDLICDVYDSLFAVFAETRNLLLELPPREFERSSGVASLILRVQNDGIRPHLTRWQADFTRWWVRVEKSAANQDRSPQSIQRDYPQYSKLIADLNRTNTELAKFADELLRIARTDRRRRSFAERLASWRRRTPPVVPVAPTIETPPIAPPTPDAPIDLAGARAKPGPPDPSGGSQNAILNVGSRLTHRPER